MYQTLRWVQHSLSMAKIDDSILLHIVLANFLPHESIMKFMTKSFWPLLALLKNGAIYLRGLNIQLQCTRITKILNIS
jgi:hypothetical protein